MKTPNMIYLQVCHGCELSADELKDLKGQGLDICTECWKTHPFDTREVSWCKDRIDDNDVAYFSEEAVRELLREEYSQCAGLIKKVAKVEDLIKIDESVESAINKLKGGKE